MNVSRGNYRLKIKIVTSNKSNNRIRYRNRKYIYVKEALTHGKMLVTFVTSEENVKKPSKYAGLKCNKRFVTI